MKMLFDSFKSKSIVFICFCIFICKLFALIFLSNFHFIGDNRIVGDADGYVKLAYNYVVNGHYYISGFQDDMVGYVIRMPGMAIILVPLLTFFSISQAVKLFVIIQIIIQSIAFGILFKYLNKLVNNRFILFSVFLFLSLGSYLDEFNSFVLSETIGSSLFIIASVYLLAEEKLRLNAKFIAVCFLITWLIFLRPFFIVFIPFFVFKIADFSQIKISVALFLKSNKLVYTFSFIFLFFIGLWTYRNYQITNKIIPYEYSIRTDKSGDLLECEPMIRDYIVAFGGNRYTLPYDYKTSNYIWFLPNHVLTVNNFYRPDNKIFPPDLFNDKFTIDSLISIRSLIDSVYESPINSEKRKQFFDLFKLKMDVANKTLASNTNFFYKFKARKRAILCLLYQPVQNKKFVNNNIINMFIIVLNSIMNVFFITVIVFISFFQFIKRKNFINYYYIYLPAFFMFLLFSIIICSSESRCLFTFYPAFLIVGLNVFKNITNQYNVFKIIKIGSISAFILLLAAYGVYINFVVMN